MTTYYVDTITCPKCGVQLAACRVGSCNTFGAAVFTDGYVRGPMYEESSSILTCPHCGTTFWREDASIDQSMPYFEFDKKDRHLSTATKAHRLDFPELVEQRIWRTPEQEKYVRIRAWWVWNDDDRKHARPGRPSPEAEADLKRLVERLGHPNADLLVDLQSWWNKRKASRENVPLGNTLPEVAVANLERLLDLLGQTGEDAVIKAEILRELGRFEDCLAELGRTFDDGYARALSVIRKLAHEGNRRVSRIV